MSVANVYAKALFETASEGKPGAPAMDELEAQLRDFANIVDSSKEARVALTGPITTSKEKAALVESLAKKAQVSPLLTQFLVLLARKERLGVLREIQNAFHTVRLTAEGGMPGDLVVAEPVGDADVSGLAQAFSRKFGKRVVFNVSTDPSLLAGMKVTVNGVTYDGTLRAQLQRLRDRVLTGIHS